MNTFNGYKHFMRQAAVIGMAMMTLILGSALTPAYAAQKSFDSPEDAANALLAAATSKSHKDLLNLFGKSGEEFLFTGDKVADKNTLEAFVTEFNLSHKIVMQSDEVAMLYLGKDEWPFLIPIVKKGTTWKFDTKAGKQDLLDRHIGKNELSAIQVVRAYVDAQREYYLTDHNGDGILEYATKFLSSKGKKDGLYWPEKEGEQASPMGPLIAKANAAGYATKKNVPYYGYYYKILKAQGKDATGGAYDYMANGHMIGGFAIIAYPARYGVTGVKSFIANQDGVVYEMDLGSSTTKIAKKVTLFNPDDDAQVVDDSPKSADKE